MSNEQDYPNNENAVLDVANVHDQSAVRSFIGQGPHHPHAALPLSARTNSDLIHCSSQNSSLIGRTATQFQESVANFLKIWIFPFLHLIENFSKFHKGTPKLALFSQKNTV